MSLPHADDATSTLSRRPDHNYHAFVRNIPRLAVVASGILSGHGNTGKHLLDPKEIQAAFAQCPRPLEWIAINPHRELMYRKGARVAK